jgi:hypothetical protein
MNNIRITPRNPNHSPFLLEIQPDLLHQGNSAWSSSFGKFSSIFFLREIQFNLLPPGNPKASTCNMLQHSIYRHTIKHYNATTLVSRTTNHIPL